MIPLMCINLTWEVAKMSGNGRSIRDGYNLQVLIG